VRLKWWLPRHQWNYLKTYDQISQTEEKYLKKIKSIKIPDYVRKEMNENTSNSNIKSPIFFGHYWFTGTPKPLSSKAACLDYSVAKGGHLVSYRWDGEQELDASKFVWI